VSLPLFANAADVLRVKGNTAGDLAIVIDGQGYHTAPVTDLTTEAEATEAETTAPVDGALELGAVELSQDALHEMLIYSTAHGLFYQSWSGTGPWTPADDEIHIQLPDQISLPLTIHAASSLSGDAKSDLEDAQELFEKIYCGVKLDASPEVDVLSVTVPDDLKDAGCTSCTTIKNTLGFAAGRLNVYYLDNPETSSPAGESAPTSTTCPCYGTTIILVYEEADPLTLAHELGHALGLSHLKNDSNLMDDATFGSDSRLTTGQCFRCNFEPVSVLNELGLRTGLPQRDCLGDCANAFCPEVAETYE
jgi:hypothetical protein